MMDNRVSAHGLIPAGLTQASGAPSLRWPREVQDFVPWLAENIDLLGECLGLRLEIVKREAHIGENLRADIVATDNLGRFVVIEAQLGYSDHTHLGQLIAYAFLTDADLVVWVAATKWADGAPFRVEHTMALSKLNVALAGGVQFQAVEVSLESDLYPVGTEPADMPLTPRLRLLDLSRPGMATEQDRAVPPLLDMTALGRAEVTAPAAGPNPP